MKASTPLRALEIVHSIPSGHIIFQISDDRSSPHLRAGEFAVIDTTDRRPVAGEIYLIEWNSGRRDVVLACRAFVKGRSDDEINDLWVGSYAPTSEFEGRPLRNIDGPYTPEHLSEKLVGRVVGLFVSDFDEVAS